jgi:type II secretory ATPase GspE/PulE/Tfp pilus assembly ATPase PilB-like protein
VSEQTYFITCWNCLGEFDAVAAVWCSDDPKNPTKLCPFCLHCFCDASAEYKQQFWRHAPAPLVDELQTLSQSQDRLGDILIRMKKITTPQLLEVLIEQKETGRKLGEILVRQGLVRQADVDVGLRLQGVDTLKDTRAGDDSGRVYWEHSSPESTLDYLLALGARKRASDVTLEPQPDQVTIRYRIDGFSFRVDPIPKAYAATLEQALFAMFDLDPARRGSPLSSKSTARLGDTEFDMILRTVPGPHGVGATIKLVNRSTFIKDFTTLGLELEDRVRLVEEIRSGLGLLLVTSPAFEGADTTFYAIMSVVADGLKDVVSIEAPIHWVMENARQIEAETGPEGPRIEATLRAMVAVRPEVLMLSAVPDQGTAVVASQLASSRLVVGAMTAPSAATALASLRGLGIPPPLLAGSLGLVTGQRLVRTLCRICTVPDEPPSARTLSAHGIDEEEAQTLRFFKGKGCPTCNRVGYRGRRALFELLPSSAEVRSALEQGLPAPEIEEAALDSGMISVRERCLELVKKGITSFDEFARLRL